MKLWRKIRSTSLYTDTDTDTETHTYTHTGHMFTTAISLNNNSRADFGGRIKSAFTV